MFIYKFSERERERGMFTEGVGSRTLERPDFHVVFQVEEKWEEGGIEEREKMKAREEKVVEEVGTCF